jgi:hypothetical protein
MAQRLDGDSGEVCELLRPVKLAQRRSPTAIIEAAPRAGSSPIFGWR